VRLTPDRLLLLSFGGLILLGTLALLIPGSTVGRPIQWDEALFTAASAVCVTGLIVLDTGRDFTLQGQLIILTLIQLGGLGILTFSSWLLLAMGRRLSVHGSEAMFSAFTAQRRLDLRRLIGRVVVFTVVVEAVGCLFLWVRFQWDLPPVEAFYQAFFHAISAFCNAGFSLNSDSLMAYKSDLTVNVVVMGLIILGGLGFIVQAELFERVRKRNVRPRLTLHTRLVLGVTLFLWLFGAVCFFVMERTNVLRDVSPGTGVLASLFQSATCRTAGFNSVDTSQLAAPTLLFMLFLMFVGASPGSTGGGIKTTTFGILIMLVVGRLRGRRNVELMGRQIPSAQVSKALGVLVIGGVSFAAILFGLQITESIHFGRAWMRSHFLDYAFETVSALGTVGLSTGMTPLLSVPGRVIVVLAMFVGRLGPLTVAYSVIGERSGVRYEYPEENVMVG
jgi:trk system potassium uptake protein TrkH